MPSVLVRNGRVVTRNGRAVLDTPSCRTLCCGGIEPIPCCIDGQPNLCGREFSTCVTRYEYEEENTLTTRGVEAFSNTPSGQCNEPIPGGCVFNRTTRRTYDAVMPDGPYRMPFIVEQCRTTGLIPADIEVGLTDTYTSSGNCFPAIDCSAPDTSESRRECLSFSTGCPIPGSGTGDLRRTDPLFGGRLSGYFAGDPDSLRLVDGTVTTSVPTFCNGQFVGDTVTTTTITRQWVVGLGVNRLIAERRVTIVTPGTYRILGQGSCPTGGFVVSTTETQVSRSVLEWVVSVVTNCDGSPGPGPCNGGTSVDCDGNFTYIRGLPCIGQTPQPPDVVFLARNVSACRVMAVGSACYIVKPTNPRTNDPTGAVIDYRIVDSNAGSSTCCACISDCPNQYIQPRPCWQNVSRGPTGAYVIGESQIDPDPCCCSENDIITINQISGDITFTGQRTQYWRLRDGPISFRRGDTAFAREIYSSVKYADGSNVFGGPDSPGFLHGELSNNPPLDCAWGSDLGNFIQFGVPQNGAAAQPVGSNTLPCPSTPGLSLGGWTIENFSVTATCRQFAYQATYTYSGGGTFRAMTTVTVTPSPDSENQRCGGGCKPLIPPGLTGIPGVFTTLPIRDIIG